MHSSSSSPLHRLLATKYDLAKEDDALAILEDHPELARLEWPGVETGKNPFIDGSTALHYAANDGKLRLMRRLIELGADVDASRAHWFRSVLSWAANNARLDALRLLLEAGASPDALDALHAAAWGGSARGQGREGDYADALRILVNAGADVNDRRHTDGKTPLAVALESGNRGALEVLRELGASPA